MTNKVEYITQQNLSKSRHPPSLGAGNRRNNNVTPGASEMIIVCIDACTVHVQVQTAPNAQHDTGSPTSAIYIDRGHRTLSIFDIYNCLAVWSSLICLSINSQLMASMIYVQERDAERLVSRAG